MSPEPELFVICPTCSSEVSPYVTECPYCGNRLRKRAPDLKKQGGVKKKRSLRAGRRLHGASGRAGGRRERAVGGRTGAGAWLESADEKPRATIALVGAAIVASVIAISFSGANAGWIYENLVSGGAIGETPWKLLSAPFLNYSFASGFVCLTAFALFGGGIERRCGARGAIIVWIVCGALGVIAAPLIGGGGAAGSYAAAVGSLLAWTILVHSRGELRELDLYGLTAVAAVLFLLPLASLESVWTQAGGVLGGVLCGLVLSRLAPRD